MIILMFQGCFIDVGVLLFQVLMMMLVGCVGIGNIVGVVIVIIFGGLGVFFWMWMVVFLGVSFVFVEFMLGQVYKEKINGEYCGGFVFYIEKGLGVKWYVWLFVIVIIFFCGLLMSGV